MSSKSISLRAFASSRETKKESGKPALVPKLRFPEFGEGFHAKARSREVEEEGCNEFRGFWEWPEKRVSWAA
jgi:hypothetical protein